MHLLGKPFDLLSDDDFPRLLRDGIPEGPQLEYKLTLPGGTDSDKREFCADVTALANSTGGHLVYGIGTEQGAPTSMPGLANAGMDDEKLRLEQILASLVEPRLVGHRIEDFQPPGSGPVLVIEVPRSWQAPHLVRQGEGFRVHRRHSSGKIAMTYTEIRNAFSQRDQVQVGIQRWRSERLEAAHHGRACARLPVGPRLSLHIVPFVSLDPGFQVNLRLPNQALEALRPPDGYGSLRPNFDGVIRADIRSDGACNAYAQIFRDGRVEAVDLGLFDGGLASVHYEQAIMNFVHGVFEIYSALGVQFPVALMLSIAGARDCQFHVRNRMGKVSFDREVMEFPPVVLDSRPAEVGRALRPMFDMVWNAAGLPACTNYDDEGNWDGNRQR